MLHRNITIQFSLKKLYIRIRSLLHFINITLALTADSFLEKFPYCIPSMFSALISVVGVVTVGCLLPDKPEDKQ